MKLFSPAIYNKSTISSCSGETMLKIEDFLKECFLQYDTENAHLYNVSALEEIRSFLHKEILNQFHVDIFLEETLSEDFFKNFDHDVFLVRHPRFLPAFPHSHDFFEIMCVLNGSCSNSIGGQTYMLQAGDILIIAPGTMHTISGTNEDSLIINLLIRSNTFDSNFFYILKDQTILSEFFKNTLYHNEKFSYLLFHASVDSEVFTILTALYQEECDNKRYKNAVKNQLVELFFSLLLRNHEKDLCLPNPNGSDEENNFIFILKYMEQRYQNVTLQELAHFFHYSERHMIRLLKEYTGQSFSQNIQKIKLKHAAELLITTDLSQKQIASRVGYSNPNHLKKLFIQQYQMTPAEYRALNKEI